MQDDRTPRRQPRRISLDSANAATTLLYRLTMAAQEVTRTAGWYLENIPGDAPVEYARTERFMFRKEGGREQWKRDLDELDKCLDAVHEWLGDKRVTFTDAEREALLLAASEVTDHDDAMDAFFDEQGKRAVLRAVAKLRGER